MGSDPISGPTAGHARKGASEMRSDPDNLLATRKRGLTPFPWSVRAAAADRDALAIAVVVQHFDGFAGNGLDLAVVVLALVLPVALQSRAGFPVRRTQVGFRDRRDVAVIECDLD